MLAQDKNGQSRDTDNVVHKIRDNVGQSRDTDNVGHKTRMDNLETLTMLGTRQEWTI